MNKNIKRSTERLIDSVWTLEYELVSSTEIKIIRYDRTNVIGYNEERQLQRHCIIESAGRIATEVLIAPYKPFECWATEDTATHRYTVVNPAYIFSYEQDEQYEGGCNESTWDITRN